MPPLRSRNHQHSRRCRCRRLQPRVIDVGMRRQSRAMILRIYLQLKGNTGVRERAVPSLTGSGIPRGSLPTTTLAGCRAALLGGRRAGEKAGRQSGSEPRCQSVEQAARLTFAFTLLRSLRLQRLVLSVPSVLARLGGSCLGGRQRRLRRERRMLTPHRHEH